MKGKLFRRITSVVLAGAMVLSLSGCGNSEASKIAEANNLAAKQSVYSYEDIDLGIDLENVGVYGMNYVNDRMYILLEDYSGQFGAGVGARIAVETPVVEVETEEVEGETTTDIAVEEPLPDEYVYTGPTYVLVSANVDGTDVKQSILDLGEENTQNSYMNRIIIGRDGHVIGVQESYVEDLTDPMNPIYKTINYLYRWDEEGTLLWKKDMVEYVGDEVDYYYPSQMLTQEDGSVMFFSWEGMGATVDKDGNLVAPIEMDPEMASRMGMLFQKSDGTTYMTSYNDDYTKLYISTFDIQTGTEGEKIELPGTLTNYSFFAGYHTDFTLTNNKGVYTYNIGDEEPVQIMDFINSDFPSTYINNVVILDDSHMVGYYHDQTDYKIHFAYFTKVNPEDVPDKNTIMLGCMYLDYNVRSRVLEFNKSNPLYRIAIKDYSTYSTMEDYMAGATQLNNDIISNQVPDILLVNSDMDVNDYINKGVLADLSEMIAKDEELANV